MMVLVDDELPKHEPVGIPAEILPIHIDTRSSDILRNTSPQGGSDVCMEKNVRLINASESGSRRFHGASDMARASRQ